MTVDEVLASVRGTQRCIVTWNSTTGEFVEVFVIEPQTGRAQISSLVAKVETQLGMRVGSNTFDSAKVTREALQQLQSETVRVATRRTILHEWSTATVDELLRILERGEYPSVMKKEDDSRIILDHLWELHRDELTTTIQDRMHRLVGSVALSERASFACNAYLLALRDEGGKLVELWRTGDVGSRSWADTFVLMDCFCHVQVEERSVVNDIIGIIEKPYWIFGPRFEAMMAVGKLESGRGRRGADIIREVVFDSTPSIIAARDRVIERLTTEPTIWITCTVCCHGRVHSEGCTAIACPNCLGLGVVRR
jgi:hypothetical protein